MTVQVRLPGEAWAGVEAGTEALLERWLVTQGAQVQQGQPIAEIVLVKTNMQVEAPADGELHAGSWLPRRLPSDLTRPWLKLLLTDVARVGLIVNPHAGRDVRRLVAAASSLTNHERTIIVRRVLAGLLAAGADEVLYIPDRYGLVPRAADEVLRHSSDAGNDGSVRTRQTTRSRQRERWSRPGWEC